MKKILNLGCGNSKKKMPFYGKIIGLDLVDLPEVDIVHDLNKYPWPVKDSEFEAIYADNVLEHLDSIICPLEEIWRISKDKGKIKIIVPLFPGVWTYADPTHKQVFTYMSFNYFLENHGLNYYSKVRFKIIKRKIKFHKILKFMEFVNCCEFFKKIYYIFFSQIIPPKYLEIDLIALKN
jgi:predicted SAM-dependent methyltransferase